MVDYTATTIHTFNDSCCTSSQAINYVGMYPANKFNTILNCPNNTNTWVQFFKPEVIDIPTQKPDMEEVMSVQSSVQIISQRVIKTPTVTGYTNTTGVIVPGSSIDNAEGTRLTGRKLIIEGLLHQKVIYTADVPEQSVHSAHFSIPFSVFIVLPVGTPLIQKIDVIPAIEDMYVCQLSPRSLFTNTTIFIKAGNQC